MKREGDVEVETEVEPEKPGLEGIQTKANWKI